MASLGILASDQRPEWWPWWVGGFLLVAIPVLIIQSTWLPLALTFAIFAFWHGYQVATDEGNKRSQQRPFDDGEHAVTLLVLSEPKFDQLQSIQFFFALVCAIDNRPANFRVYAECSGEPLSYGDRLTTRGRFQIQPKPVNPGEFDFGDFLRRQSIYLNFRSRGKAPVTINATNQGNPLVAIGLAVRHKIVEALQEGIEEDLEAAQAIQGMILGARGETDESLKRLFRDTGTIHLFAASGLQLGLLTGLAWKFLRYVRLPRRLVGALIVPVTIGYCALTEFHPATVRAAVMAILIAVGASVERPVATLNSLCGSGVLILIHDTQQLFQIGFQLSFVAVATILMSARPFADLLYRPFKVDAFMPVRLLSPLQRVWHTASFRACELLSLSAVCWGATAPILILQDHRISLVAVFANVLVVPLATTVTLLGVASLIAGGISTQFAGCLNNTSWFITKCILMILHSAVLIPGHCCNVSPASLFASDHITALSARYGRIIHAHINGHDWLVNTGSLSEWRAVTAPYLRYEGVNQLNELIECDPPAHEAKLMAEVREEFNVPNVIPSTSMEPLAEAARLLYSGAAAPDDGPVEILATNQTDRFVSARSPIELICVQLGRFRILILPTVANEILTSLKQRHADVVCCGRLRDRRFPRELLINKFSPSVLILTGTKPELAENTQGNGAYPKCFFIKQIGAVTVSLFNDELRVCGHCGAEILLPSLNR
jgi:ComEC/Rec2-related protein